MIRESEIGSGAASLARRYRAVRAQTAALASPLSAEDCQIQSMPDASPTKWHLAHTTWFFETFVLESLRPDHRAFDQRFRVLFNSYYNSVGVQPARATRGLVSRPGLDDVRAYRSHVDAAMAAMLDGGALDAEHARVVELGLQHEQQHQELILTDIKHALCTQTGRPRYTPPPAAAVVSPLAPPPLSWHASDAGVVHIGHDGAGFAFDNELPRHPALVPAAALASRLVTCSEYLDFMRDGGYDRPDLWLSAGWDVVRSAGWRAPLYWEQRDGDWWIATLHGERLLAAAEPVCHLSFFEADAYARWAGARLPTEFEWERAAADADVDGNFVESGALHPRPVVPSVHAASPAQLFGDVWEWTASPYVGYPGYRPRPGALGEYNGKFMSDQWVLRGGSCVTPRTHVRATYRNFFPAATRWQFSGVRLARDVDS